jgi:polyisoprenoid-binding protein YceI
MKTTKVAAKTKWAIDQAHSEISFRVRHLMIAHVNGAFKRFDASIYTNGEDFSTAEIDLWIDASSIATGDDVRDKHLRSSEFFDTKRHKQLTFTSSTLGLADQFGNHELWGELTMLGVARNVMLNVSFGGIVNDPWGNERSGFTISGKISRSEWGLIWNSPTESGGLMVSDEVAIFCELELINTGHKCLTMDLD